MQDEETSVRKANKKFDTTITEEGSQSSDEEEMIMLQQYRNLRLSEIQRLNDSYQDSFKI